MNISSEFVDLPWFPFRVLLAYLAGLVHPTFLHVLPVNIYVGLEEILVGASNLPPKRTILHQNHEEKSY